MRQKATVLGVKEDDLNIYSSQFQKETLRKGTIDVGLWWKRNGNSKFSTKKNGFDERKIEIHNFQLRKMKKIKKEVLQKANM